MSGTSPSIGRLSEGSLHAALKEWLAEPGDQLEVALDGYVIDILRQDKLIEIQTRHLYALRRKLDKLLAAHTVHLVHPIAVEKWIVRVDGEDQFISRRKSPKRGQMLDAFKELVRIPDLIARPGFSLEILLIQAEEIWRDDGQGSWRRKGWSRADRRFLGALGSHTFVRPADYLAVLPADLAEPFTNNELAAAAGCSVALAQKITYTLRGLGVIELAGRRGRANAYRIA